MTIIRHNSGEDLAKSLSVEIVRDLENAKNPFLVLPGGSSAVPLMTELAKQPLPWAELVIGTTDERCVPMDNAHSNAGQVQRILGDIARVVPLWKDGEIAPMPPFAATVMVLGLGVDGHFASIFPGAPFDTDTMEPFSVTAPKEPRDRVTLPVNIILQSHRVILLVCGAEKMTLMDEILMGGQSNLPIAKLLALCDKIDIHMAP